MTGERALESACRAKYNVIEPDRADNRDGKRIKRYVDHYRPIHSWTEKSVWDILERWKIIPHPCYRLGWGRCSCSACIFGNKNQWASLNAVDPEQVKIITNYEKQFGLTINRTKSVPELIASGTPYEAVNDMEARKQALSPEYTGEITQSGNYRLGRSAKTQGLAKIERVVIMKDQICTKLQGYQFEFNGETMHFDVLNYQNGRIALEIMTKDEPYATLTVNLPDKIQCLGEREIFIKTYSENEYIAERCREMTDIFFDTKKTIQTGFVRVEVWRIKDEVELP